VSGWAAGEVAVAFLQKCGLVNLSGDDIALKKGEIAVRGIKEYLILQENGFLQNEKGKQND